MSRFRWGVPTISCWTVLDSAGRIWAWGYNGYGQLGDGSTSNRARPVTVGLDFLEGESIVQIQVGSYHNLLLDSAGRLWAWGNNGQGQLGDGSTTRRSRPVSVELDFLERKAIVQLQMGSSHNLLLDSAGRLWAWGNNGEGQLGDGRTENHSRPVQVVLPVGGLPTAPPDAVPLLQRKRPANPPC